MPLYEFGVKTEDSSESQVHFCDVDFSLFSGLMNMSFIFRRNIYTGVPIGFSPHAGAVCRFTLPLVYI